MAGSGLKVEMLKPVNQVMLYMEFQFEYFNSACINDIRLNTEWLSIIFQHVSMT